MLNEMRRSNNNAGCIILKNLLNQLSKGRVNLDHSQNINISLCIMGSDRDFNRCVNSLSRAFDGIQVRRTLQTSAADNGSWFNVALLKGQNVEINLKQQAQTV